MAFVKRLLGYLGVCVVEALLVVLLYYLVLCVVLPRMDAQSSGGASLCAALAFFFLLPIFAAGGTLACLLAKIVALLIPPGRRHWALAVYWGLTAAFVAYESVRQVARHAAPAPNVGSVVLHVTLMSGVPALVLTLTHFALMPFFLPGSGVRGAFRALFRRGGGALQPPEGSEVER